jgi:guanosine-3',5'-bis(diphosphate) 3'-pyrophosphohydrolase
MPVKIPDRSLSTQDITTGEIQNAAPPGDIPVALEDVFTRGEITARLSGISPQFIESLTKRVPEYDPGRDGEIVEVLKDLQSLGLDDRIITAVRKDFDCDENEKLLLKLIASAPEGSEQMMNALQLCKSAHRGQHQKKAHDPAGFANIPYINHCINVATMALCLNMSPVAVQAALLHDVLEDTPTTAAELKKSDIDATTIALIQKLTRSPEETRPQYMERVGKMKGEAKILKCLDRYHNLLRAFSMKDAAYLDRYISEAEHYYLVSFQTTPQLSGIKDSFSSLLDQVKRFRSCLT